MLSGSACVAAAALGGAAVGSAMTAHALNRARTSIGAKPDPSWRPGHGPSGGPPMEEMVTIVPNELPRDKSVYPFLISSVVPRPIAFVSTKAPDGKINVAPFSFFGLMCHDPPTLAFCTVPRKDQDKDTLKNCKETKECVVNMVRHFLCPHRQPR